jgi:hypothetical protein
MVIEAFPPVPEAELQAIRLALRRSGMPLDGRPAAYESPWRRAGAREAIDNEPATARYARSPRSMRGATRA